MTPATLLVDKATAKNTVLAALKMTSEPGTAPITAINATTASNASRRNLIPVPTPVVSMTRKTNSIHNSATESATGATTPTTPRIFAPRLVRAVMPAQTAGALRTKTRARWQVCLRLESP